MHTNVDILICSLPVSPMSHAPAAPALLKACVEKSGFTAKTVDLSQKFYTEISNSNFARYSEDTSYLLPVAEFDQDSYDQVVKWLQISIDHILKTNPKFVGLSIFSYYMIRSAYLLSRELKKIRPDIKIILGGYGLTQSANSLKHLPEIKSIDLVKSFDVFMTEKGLADYCIIGEGENALVEILEGSIPALISNRVDVNLYEVPVSNFDDYNLSEYSYLNHNIILPITGSKGCVRQCSFCDVPQKFGRFKYRTGEHIAQEMIAFKTKYGINRFTFTDSLINGSMKSFMDLITVLANHNESVPTADKLTWSAQYISRPIGQVSEKVYELMSKSGAESLIIGVESGSNSVLEAMNKKVKIEDVDYEMSMFEKYGLKAVLLILTGFYNETYDDFLDTLKTLVRYQKYVASGTLIKVDLGHPLVITPETVLYQNLHNLGIKLDEVNAIKWTVDSNPDLTLNERIRRRLVAELVCEKLGVPTSMSAYKIKQMAKLIDDEFVYR